MKKVNFNPLNNERIDNLRKEYLNQILAHPVCKKFIDKYEITEDEMATYEKEVQKILDNISAKIDKLMAEKEKEIMQV